MIIDIHSHIKREDKNLEEVERELLSDMERNNVDVRVISCMEGTNILENNQYISKLVSKHPNQLIGCAVSNPKEKNCKEQCQQALELPGIKILEFNSLEHGYYPDVCEGVDEVLKVALEKGVIVKVFSGIGSRAMPQQWLKYVKKYPEIKFVFLHMGCFDYGYGCVDLAVKYPNVYLETSNQYEVQILKKSVMVVPKEKLLFGSSYPERLTRCSLDVYDMFHLSEERKRALFGENASRLLGLYTEKWE